LEGRISSKFLLSPTNNNDPPKSFTGYIFCYVFLVQTMKTMYPTYNLKPSQLNGNGGFYHKLSDFTVRWLEAELPNKQSILDSFLSFNLRTDCKLIRTPEEAYLELLTLGIYLENYSNASRRILPLFARLLKRMYHIRNSTPALKKYIDRVRGILAYFFLREKSGDRKVKTLTDMGKLLKWLSATGEFTQEVERLTDWHLFLLGLSVMERNSIIAVSRKSAANFTLNAKQSLGIFTAEIENFLKRQPSIYKYRENYFFTARKENEYFLNMFGAEVINRVEREKFRKTRNKLLLLPTCMRQNPADRCKAIYDGKGMLCQACNANCNIHRTASSIGYKGVKTYIIHHSSMFSKNLKGLASQTDTGIIGVACALNLLAGGYELKKLNIPAQCIYLDYSGCKKHWHPTDSQQPTSIQMNRLLELVG
jgi:uncharacterized protein